MENTKGYIFSVQLISAMIALLVADATFSGLSISSFGSFVLCTVLFLFSKAYIVPFLTRISISIMLITFGMFITVINALMLIFIGALTPGMDIDSFGTAFLAGLIISIVRILIHRIAGLPNSNFELKFEKN